MKIAVLEKSSVTNGDIDFSFLDSVAEITYYDQIDSSEIIKTISDFDGIIINKTIIDKNVIDLSHKYGFALDFFDKGRGVISFTEDEYRRITKVKDDN